MKQSITILVLIIAIIIAVVVMTKKKNIEAPLEENVVTQNQIERGSFTSLTSTELNEMLQNKDFTMIDVHTPEQVHIPQTDYIISYDDIDSIVEVAPDKDAKIVLYCRSGNMSKTAAQDLVDLGYTNVFDLTRGMNEWNGEGRETIPVGDIL